MSQRDYTNWVEGYGDTAKPPDYNPDKYEAEICADPRVAAWVVCVPSWRPGGFYRVRVRHQEPTAQPAPEPPAPTTDQEPPVLKSLVIRPDGCSVLIGGTSVNISHSAALDLAGELCRSRRQ